MMGHKIFLCRNVANYPLIISVTVPLLIWSIGKNWDTLITVFDLISTHFPISAQYDNV